MTDTASHSALTFTEEQDPFREAMRGFARSRFGAGYHARVESETFPETEYRQLVEQGLLGLMVPERVGGQGADPMAYAIAMEELSWADSRSETTVGKRISSASVMMLPGRQRRPDLRRDVRPDGTPQIQTLVIARQLLGREAVPA